MILCVHRMRPAGRDGLLDQLVNLGVIAGQGEEPFRVACRVARLPFPPRAASPQVLTASLALQNDTPASPAPSATTVWDGLAAAFGLESGHGLRVPIRW